MTNGNPARQLWMFAIPMVLGNIFQQLYTIADSIIVGNFVGPDALAAVGASTSITFLFIAIATGASVGSSVVISQLFGAGLYSRMKTAISTVLISVVGLSAALMGVGLFLHRAILRAMRTPEHILADASSYLRIYFWGIVFLFVYNTLTAVFNALGLSRIPLGFLVFSSVFNVALDLILVIRYGMGVAGVAIATLAAQGISALLSLAVLLFHLRKIKTDEPYRRFDAGILKKICIVAVPSTIQQSIVSVGMILMQSLVNGYGAVVMAGYAAATKIDSIAIVPMVNVGSAVSTFTAQNMGARKPERIPQGLRAGLCMVLCIGLCITGVLFLFGEQMIGLFVDTAGNPGVIALGTQYLHVVSLFYVVMGTMNNFSGVLRGAGDMKVFMASSLCNLATRVILAYTLSAVPGIGQRAIWWAVPVSWFVGLCISGLRYRSGKWKEHTLI